MNVALDVSNLIAIVRFRSSLLTGADTYVL